MKKRRVLALLLAFSMTFGSNGMSVMAMETSPVENAVTIENEDTAEETQVADLDEADKQAESAEQKEKASDGSEESTEKKEEASDSAEESAEKKEEASDSAEESAEQKEDTSDRSEEASGQTEDEADKTEEETDKTEEASNEGAEASDKEEEASDRTTEGDDAPDEGTGTVEDEAPFEVTPDTAPEGTSMELLDNGCVLFTDETGMQSVFDVSESDTNQYTVQDGVLIAATDKDGNKLTGNVIIPDGLGIKEIAATAFEGNTAITYVMLPAGVTNIQKNAFKACNALTGVYLPNGLETIGESAFEGCAELKQLAIPKSLKVIGDRAFYQNRKLFMIYTMNAYYSSLKSIGESAFYECQELGKFCSDLAFVMPRQLENIGAHAFYKCDAVTSIDMNESVTTLGEGAFQDCSGLTEVTLSSKLEKIADKAFSGCNNLLNVTFKNGNKEIGKYAFEGCISLSVLVIDWYVETIGDYAFKGCTRLISVTIENPGIIIGEMAFPNDKNLTLIGRANSNVEKYVKDKVIKFIDKEEAASNTYTCTTKVIGSDECEIVIHDKDGDIFKDSKDGYSRAIAVGEQLTVMYKVPAGNTKGWKPVWSSLKCNGNTILPEKNADNEEIYSFKMPAGGAHITMEFEATNVKGQAKGTEADITQEFSNGEFNYEADSSKGIVIKEGQYTRWFLIDKKDNNRPIDYKNIKFAVASENAANATIDEMGVIHAIKAGQAKISATFTGGDGKEIKIQNFVIITACDVESLKVQAIEYDAKKVEITESVDGIQTAVIDKYDVGKDDIYVTLVATAYDDKDDDVSVDLKWATSDAKIAELPVTETKPDSPKVKVRIPKNETDKVSGGEATITVTATKKDASAKPRTVTQKFIIQVVDCTPRLSAGTLTVNPLKETGAVLEIVSAYGKSVDPATVKLLDANKKTLTVDFSITYLKLESDQNAARFAIDPAYSGILEKSYPLLVSINEGAYELPLTLKVKKSSPNPKVKFDKKTKINTFYTDMGTELAPIVTGLGNEKVSCYRLEAKSSNEEDRKFLENFMIDEQTGVIRQQTDTLLCRKNTKKPVVSGYLVLSFEGYKNAENTDSRNPNADRKYLITIPTEKKAPSFVLDRTTDTFSKGCGAQRVLLTVKDKKTKQPVDLSQDGYHVQLLPDGVADSVQEIGVGEDGKIELYLTPRKGSIKIRLTNDCWTEGNQMVFKYGINTAVKNATAKLTRSNIRINRNYLETAFHFELASNRKDTVFVEEQEFVAKAKPGNAAEYEKLSVTYTGEIGTVQVMDTSIKPGKYSFVCNPVMVYDSNGNEIGLNKVVLTVEINQTLPSVTLKGNAGFNLLALGEYEAYAERAEFKFTVKNAPEGYGLDEFRTLETIQCVTKNFEGYEQYFNWEITDNVLRVSLSDDIPREVKKYKFKIVPVVTDGFNEITTKAVNVNINVYKAEVMVSLNAKGKINLVNRTFSEYTTSNSIVYTPVIKNMKSSVVEAKIFDAGDTNPTYDSEESELFRVEVLNGKLYVSPKEGAPIENKKNYKVKIWMKLDQYSSGEDHNGNGVWANKIITIKGAQVLPKLKTDTSLIRLYMSNKNYGADFTIMKKDEKAAGKIEKVYFDENDKAAKDTFDMTYEVDDDGYAMVSLKLKSTNAYRTDSTNKVMVYVDFAGQGTNTKGVPVVINVNIRK